MTFYDEKINKTALITGAARRIGKAFSLHLAEKGWNLALHYHKSADDAKKLMQELRSKYPTSCFHLFEGDLEMDNYAATLMKSVVSKFGPIDLLLNNASVFTAGDIRNVTLASVNSHMNINFRAPLMLISEYCRLCKEGNIVNMLDTRIKSNQFSHAAYSLSKKALAQLTQMAALELAPAFRVNGIAPGATLAPWDKTLQYLEGLEANIPMKSSGGVKQVLDALDFLIYNPHITGQILYCDGGEQLL